LFPRFRGGHHYLVDPVRADGREAQGLHRPVRAAPTSPPRQRHRRRSTTRACHINGPTPPPCTTAAAAAAAAACEPAEVPQRGKGQQGPGDSEGRFGGNPS
ncbi:unnamed protein product, partial [Ectocarpus fasciculatus]